MSEETETPKSAAVAGRIDGLVRLEFIANEIGLERNGFCPQCGLVSTDEDDCCILCGSMAQGAALRELMADILFHVVKPNAALSGWPGKEPKETEK